MPRKPRAPEQKAKQGEWQAKRRATNPEIRAMYRSSPRVKEMERQRAARWRAANPEKVKQSTKKWQAANPEKVKAARDKYWAEHPEFVQKLRAKAKARVQANRDRVRAAKAKYRLSEKGRANRKAYYAANRSQTVARTKAWRESNPEKTRAQRVKFADAHRDEMAVQTAKRRAKLQTLGSFTPQEWQLLLDATDHKCACCGVPEAQSICAYSKSGPKFGHLTKDHIRPISLGGNGTIDNIQPLCRPCNDRKGKKHINYLSHGDISYIAGNRRATG